MSGFPTSSEFLFGWTVFLWKETLISVDEGFGASTFFGLLEFFVVFFDYELRWNGHQIISNICQRPRCLPKGKLCTHSTYSFCSCFVCCAVDADPSPKNPHKAARQHVVPCHQPKTKKGKPRGLWHGALWLHLGFDLGFVFRVLGFDLGFPCLGGY